ncbi:UNVERIFIED_CONTAM: hypothetical protein Slati_2641400 [Sesamum latifolium]|uniref:Uncharacterized protein n=1 Tax=Sesamum latifolium TaxID=2727402 RepID=A0AAW2VVY9_9LAMI
MPTKRAKGQSGSLALLAPRLTIRAEAPRPAEERAAEKKSFKLGFEQGSFPAVGGGRGQV